MEAMLRSLRFRLPALFLVGFVVAMLVGGILGLLSGLTGVGAAYS